jgi:hypothetical protein
MFFFLRRRWLALGALVALSIAFGQNTLAAGNDVIGRGGKAGPIEEVLADLNDLGPQEVEKTDIDASLTREDLLRAQEAFHSALKSIKVSFSYQLDRRMEAPSEEAFDPVPRNFSFKITGAVKGAKQYSDFEDTTEGSPEKGRRDIVAFNGEVTQATTVNNREASVVPLRSPCHTALLEHYLHSIPILLGPDYVSERESHPEYVPVALRQEEYEVRPKLERVDGYLCHVVSCLGLDTLWIDSDHGFCVRRRVRISKGGTEEHCLRWVLIYQDYVGFAKSIWLPKSIDMYEYATHWAPPSQRGSLKSMRKMRVSDLVVNDVPDALFDLEFPPGTGVIDRTRDVYYFVPKDRSQLPDAIAQGAPIVDGVVTGLDKLERPLLDDVPVAKRRRWSTIVWLANLSIVSLLIVLFLIFRRRRVASP